MADALVLETSGETRESSSLSLATNLGLPPRPSGEAGELNEGYNQSVLNPIILA